MNRQTIVKLGKAIAARILRREIIFFPWNGKGGAFDISQGKALLPILYTYRASSHGWVTYKLLSPGCNLRYTLHAMAFSGCKPVLGQLYLSLEIASIQPGDSLQVNLLDQMVLLNDKRIDFVRGDYRPSRKFTAHFQLSSEKGNLTRFCSHYLPYEDKAIGKDYYFGDDYTDYPMHTNVTYALDLVNQYCSKVSLLDVGCALGIYTNAFLNAGFDAYGIDMSEFAVNEARKRILSNRIRQCNLDESDIPFDLTFGAFWMWDVLEHSADPKMMLNKISVKASQGSYLFLHTSNSDSLTRRIFESDWEGYSDYSHYGVDKVSAKNLSIWLRDLGWEILDWKCYNIWVFGNDPIILRLREVFQIIPELEVLLTERDLGDFILVVARKG